MSPCRVGTAPAYGSPFPWESPAEELQVVSSPCSVASLGAWMHGMPLLQATSSHPVPFTLGEQHHVEGYFSVLHPCNPLSVPFSAFLPPKPFPMLVCTCCPAAIYSQHHEDTEKATPAKLLFPPAALKPRFKQALSQASRLHVSIQRDPVSKRSGP